MDGLSGVASGMAVASLSLQLIQSIGTIKTFIRDVKGATEELKKLATQLTILNAYLEEVRNLMEQQTSQQYLPAPFMPIYECLQGYETSLGLLQEVIDKYKASCGNGTAIARVKNGIKFGFKTKDIASYAARIQRDVEYLHALLNLNSGSVL
jgi:hypothetical protein